MAKDNLPADAPPGQDAVAEETAKGFLRAGAIGLQHNLTPQQISTGMVVGAKAGGTALLKQAESFPEGSVQRETATRLVSSTVGQIESGTANRGKRPSLLRWLY